MIVRAPFEQNRSTMNLPEISELEERFVRYVKVDTQSANDSTSIPSTAIQWDLLRMLEQELRELGAADVTLTQYGYVLATVPATVDAPAPTVAFLAHVDTAPQFKADGVKPIVHHNYDGKPIVLPDDPTKVLDAESAPELAEKVGEDIVTASGTTLLGADDKAGVAIVMALVGHLLRHPEIQHGRIRICFTPDEEIGAGVEHITLEEIGADVAYTLDGGPTGELTYETFSADKALVRIEGVSIHPGSAKDRMVNAVHLAAKLVEMLPKTTRTPETTSERQGFIHVTGIRGSEAAVELNFILRDFDLEKLQGHRDLLQAAANFVAASEPRAKVTCTFKKQYRNMRYWLDDNPRPVDLALEAIRRTGLTPVATLIRGGTDGSRLTERGLPTPNIFTGMANVHGPLEWVSLQDMQRAVEACVHLAELWAGEEKK